MKIDRKTVHLHMDDIAAITQAVEAIWDNGHEVYAVMLTQHAGGVTLSAYGNPETEAECTEMHHRKIREAIAMQHKSGNTPH